MKTPKLKAVFLLSFCLGGLAIAETPPPNSVRIINMTHDGHACPAGSVGDMISPDGEAITLLFDSFFVEVEGDRTGTAATKSCDISLTLQSPPGWEFGIFRVDMRGYGSFDSGTTGWQWATYWLNGRGVSGVRNGCEGAYGNFVACKQFYGPFDDNYIHSNSLALNNMPFSPCSRTQNQIKIRTGAVVKTTQPGFRSALLTVDSFDGAVEEKYKLVWKRCDSERYQATCSVKLRDKWRVVRTLTDQGIGNSSTTARENALLNANGKCELVRRGLNQPSLYCDAANAQCTVVPI